ncbi:hypothetical protein [Burkholderia cenocepacia]|uniref:hypothetical protein n=1 Tax=Burkholderia cenocepacia TaxID=95486 RepID=UPI003D7672AC
MPSLAARPLSPSPKRIVAPVTPLLEVNFNLYHVRQSDCGRVRALGPRAGRLAATILACAPEAAPSLALFSIAWVVRGNSLDQVIGPLPIGAIVGVFGWPGGIRPMLAVAVAGAASGLPLLREPMGRRDAGVVQPARKSVEHAQHHGKPDLRRRPVM